MQKFKKRIQKIQNKDYEYYKKKGISTYNMDDYENKRKSLCFIPFNRLKTCQIEFRKTNPKQKRLNKFQLNQIFGNI